jgi:serine/threonine-protein kinase
MPEFPVNPAVLVCPLCGKNYRGDPANPAARFRCPDDKAILAPAESLNETMDLATAKKMTGEFNPDMTAPVPGSQSAPASSQSASMTGGEARRSVVASLRAGSGVGRAGGMEANVTKYQVVGKLGQGGMGQVLKVLDRDLKREVAMKLLISQGGPGGDDTLLRFIEEAQATGQLEHPNIVPVHDLGVDAEGRVYFTLKYVQGDSLKQVLKGRREKLPHEGGPVTYPEIYTPLRMLEILIDICQGVAYAHAKGVIHRDLKPDNVMLGRFGEVLVMDWGLAKVIGRMDDDGAAQSMLVSTSRTEEGSLTVDGAVAGTPAYMAPEQAMGKVNELDARTDIYSLGALLYEFLSGHAPYRGKSAMDVVEMVCKGPPPPLSAGGIGFTPIPRELRAICEKAMAREPRERYQSALALRDDLQAYLENRSVSAAPDTRLQRLGKWSKRNRRMIAAVTTTAAVLLVAGAAFLVGRKQLAIKQLLYEANYALDSANKLHQEALAGPAKIDDNDPYKAQKLAMSQGKAVEVYRDGLKGAIDPLRKVLELEPMHPEARRKLAEANMELWRLALADKNGELMKTTRAEVERYAARPNPYQDELEGKGSLNLSVTPADAEVFLFSFELLGGAGPDGKALSPRLIPVPYDPGKGKADFRFINEESQRAAKGDPLPAGATSIFRLEPTAESSLGKGKISVPALLPGSYLLLFRSAGVEIRVPFLMERRGKIERAVSIPAAAAIPDGFVYMDGGEVWMGGDTAGAPAPMVMGSDAALIARTEVKMGDYGAYLADLMKSGKGAEAKKHLPKDFDAGGSGFAPMAELISAGDIVPAKYKNANKALLAQNAAEIANFQTSPVRGITYNDAVAYIQWKAGKDGLPYRLPKDWEWENACRGADGRKYSWGNSPGKGLAIVTQGYGDSGANLSWKWKDYKDESPWGIMNLAGSAAEWTASAFKGDAKEDDPVKGQLAIRGNAWNLPPVGLECDFRTSGKPDYFHPTIGFRLALDYPPVKGAPSPLEKDKSLPPEHAGHHHHG